MDTRVQNKMIVLDIFLVTEISEMRRVQHMNANNDALTELQEIEEARLEWCYETAACTEDSE